MQDGDSLGGIAGVGLTAGCTSIDAPLAASCAEEAKDWLRSFDELVADSARAGASELDAVGLIMVEGGEAGAYVVGAGSEVTGPRTS